MGCQTYEIKYRDAITIYEHRRFPEGEALHGEELRVTAHPALVLGLCSQHLEAYHSRVLLGVVSYMRH